MASVKGALYQVHGNTEAVKPAQATSTPRLSLASMADVHTTISGGRASGSASGTKAVTPAADSIQQARKPAAGFDTLNTPQHGATFAGESHSATENIIASQTHHGGNTVLHLPDGSTITLVGVMHVDASFFH